VRSLALAAVVALTSLAAGLAATRRSGLRAAELRRALTDALSCLGLAVVFLAANVAAGIVLILGARALTRGFISFYLLNDITLPILSLIQALVFHAWARDRRHPS
jgi:hypothetical protein